MGCVVPSIEGPQHPEERPAGGAKQAPAPDRQPTPLAQLLPTPPSPPSPPVATVLSVKCVPIMPMDPRKGLPAYHPPTTRLFHRGSIL